MNAGDAAWREGIQAVNDEAAGVLDVSIIEGVERPTQPGCAISVPLVFGGFFPPRNACHVSSVSRHRLGLPVYGLLVSDGLMFPIRSAAYQRVQA